MIESTDIDWMRDAQEDILPDLATTKRPDRVNTGTGRTITYSTVAASIPVRVDPSRNTPSESVFAGKPQGRSFWTLTMPSATEIENDWRIIVTDGETYEVLGVQHHDAWSINKQAECVLVGGDD